jgi:hypothetical protein
MQTENEIIKAQTDWIKSGKIGCVFASALVKQADKIGWKFVIAKDKLEVPKDAFIMSIIFPDGNIQSVKEWALTNGFYIENIEDMYEGLRIKVGENISWVQYFGQDSHVKTRQSPYPMLSFTIKLPAHVFAKTMAKGIYHLAHASIEHFTARKANTLWEQSFAKTKKELGHSPTLREAAKTTYVK